MTELPADIKKRIDRFQPIETSGVTLYPILVDDMEEFLRCRAALEFLHQSLPVALMQIPLLTAFFQIEIATSSSAPSAAEQGGEREIKPITFFSDAMVLLCRALRLGHGLTRDQLLEQRVLVLTDTENPTLLREVRFITDEAEVISIRPATWKKLREIIAAQNGVQLEADDANPELVYAERALLAAKAPKIRFDLANKISWVAAMSHADEIEIYDWPILKFERRADVIKRTLDYLMFGIGQSSGMVSFKDGNPVPSPYYEKITDSAAMQPLGEFASGAAQQAVSMARAATQSNN